MFSRPCNWEVFLSFKEEVECKEFVKKLADKIPLFDFEVKMTLHEVGQTYDVTVSGSWASNFVMISEILNSSSKEPIC